MTLIKVLSNFLFPRECVLCGEVGSWLCTTCQERIPLVLPACPVCRARTIGGVTHPDCKPQFSLNGCLAAASLSLPPIERLVYGCKYHGFTSAAHALASLMVRAAAGAPLITGLIRTMHPIIAPLPLHPQRKRERGFNQSELIANALAHAFRLPSRMLLTRTKPTADQVKLTREERRENLAGAFTIADGVRSLPPAVILIDDVVTTGATLHAAATTLRHMRHDISIWGLVAAYHATTPDTLARGLAHTTPGVAV